MPDTTPDAVTQQKFNELLETLDQLSDESYEEVMLFIRLALNYEDNFIGRLTMAYERMKDGLWMSVNLILFFGLSCMATTHATEIISKKDLIVILVILFSVSFVTTGCLEVLFGAISYQIQKRLYGR